MECYYHPDREGTHNCAICGKSICEECGLEIAGKVYCEECLTKIVGLGVSKNDGQESKPIAEEDPIITEPVEVNVDDNIYQTQGDSVELEIPYAQEEAPAQEYKIISDDSPYNIKDSIKYSGGLESSYLDEGESAYQKPQIEETPQVAQNELDTNEKEILSQKNDEDFIYPNHDYEPQPTSARQELEDKYEKYLDDLYFDETDVPLGEQLAKDEEQYGSLTKKEYVPKKEEVVEEKAPARKKDLKEETPEEMEARLREEILKEQNLMTDKKEDKSIHNLSYTDDKEPMGIIDIILTIILVIVILIVLYYVLYLFLLNSSYPTFIDAVFALRNPQNVINAILTH